MKYFNPSYWFKLWILSAPLFNSENKGIYTKSIDNQKIKDWVSKNTSSLESINESNSFTNLSNYQPYNLNETNQNIDPFYQSYLDSFSNQQLERSNNKDYYEKSKNRHKREKGKKTKLNNLILFNGKLNSVMKKYFSFRGQIQTILEELNDAGLISRVTFENDEINCHLESPVYEINADNDENYFFVLPVILNYDINQLPMTKTSCNWESFNRIVEDIANNSNNADLQLIFSARSFYLQGFIVRSNNTEIYYYFSDAVIKIIENIQSINLGYSGRYSDIAGHGSVNIAITWPSLHNSFTVLSQFTGNNPNSIQVDLTRVILATSESFRFMIIRDKIDNLYNDNVTEDLTWHFDFQEIVKNWKDWCDNVKLIISLIRFSMISVIIADNENKKGKREINNVFCIKCTLPFINLGKATSIKVLDENTKGGNLQAGHTYVGTTNGVYLINTVGQVDRFDNLNFPIKDIILDGNGSAYVINDKSEIYHLNLYRWGSEQVNADNITFEEFSNLITVIKKSDYSWFGIIKIIKKLPINSEDEHLKAGDMYVGTDKGIFAFYRQQQINHYN